MSTGAGRALKRRHGLAAELDPHQRRNASHARRCRSCQRGLRSPNAGSPTHRRRRRSRVRPFSVAFKSCPGGRTVQRGLRILGIAEPGRFKSLGTATALCRRFLRAAASADRSKVDVRYSTQLTWINVIWLSPTQVSQVTGVQAANSGHGEGRRHDH
jgi:hypothetical protein